MWWRRKVLQNVSEFESSNYEDEKSENTSNYLPIWKHTKKFFPSIRKNLKKFKNF